MQDLQASLDHRKLAIEQVGVRGLRYPIVVLDKLRQQQHTIGNFSLSVSLSEHYKGTHMSRFIEVLHANRNQVDMSTLPSIVSTLRQRLEAESATVIVDFPYFVEKKAPVSGLESLMCYECSYQGSVGENEADFIISVRIPLTTLCPCSKAISDYGAHNQRGYLTVALRTMRNRAGKPKLFWIEDIINIAERSGSSPVYPLLKREDERYVTMHAFDNPVFVEDLVRNAVTFFKDDSRVLTVSVEAETIESIHDHSAFAKLSWSRS